MTRHHIGNVIVQERGVKTYLQQYFDGSKPSRTYTVHRMTIAPTLDIEHGVPQIEGLAHFHSCPCERCQDPPLPPLKIGTKYRVILEEIDAWKRVK